MTHSAITVAVCGRNGNSCRLSHHHLIAFPILVESIGNLLQNFHLHSSLVAYLQVAHQLLDLPKVLWEVSLRRQRLDVCGAGLIVRTPGLRGRALVRGSDVARYPEGTFDQ